MQLNYECIRALLLYFENNLKLKHNGLPEGLKMNHINLANEFPSFTHEDIYYSLRKLVEADYIRVRDKNVAPRVMIVDEITIEGHEFLEASKNETVWKKTIDFVKSKGGGIALEVLKQVLIQFAKDLFLK